MAIGSTLLLFSAMLVGAEARDQSAVRAQALLDRLRGAVGSSNPANVRALFARAEDSAYLFEMAARAGGIGKLKVKVFPAPPGWGRDAFWAIFHTFQDIEQDHDFVCALVRTPDGFLLGKEVQEWETRGHRIGHAKLDVSISPAAARVDVRASIRPASTAPLASAAVYRMNDVYEVAMARSGEGTLRVVVADERAVPVVAEGELLRAGSLLIHWKPGVPAALDLSYGAVLRNTRQDKVAEHVAYVVSRWVPSMGQLPHTTAVRVTAPRDWLMVSEGVEATDEQAGFTELPENSLTHSATFRCELPISFPKVVAGRYKLAAELKESGNGGKVFRAYHLEPVEPDRAKRDVQIMQQAISFFEKNLGPWPFPGYAVYDGDTFYGIESYSYTLLQRRVTTTFTAHEAGHTYFGGVAPCTYLKDTWNESMTQYVDSVLFSGDRDGTLQSGLRTMNIDVPLNKMFVPWAHGSASYFRGAYVMKMLENEIGLEFVLGGLKSMLADRKGKDTTWSDLRSYFEVVAGQRLDWFWRQWIEQAVYPSLEVTEASRVARERATRTFVVVRQTVPGGRAPFRLRFTLKLSRGSSHAARKVVVLDKAQDTFAVDSDFVPDVASVEVFGLSLARVGPPRPVP